MFTQDLGRLVDYTDDGYEVRINTIEGMFGPVPIVQIVRPLPDLEEEPD